MSATVLAERWRQEHGYQGKGGVVVLFDGEIQGWVNELRDPGHWQPGCFAVDEIGEVFEAVGGDPERGASHWELVDKQGWYVWEIT